MPAPAGIMPALAGGFVARYPKVIAKTGAGVALGLTQAGTGPAGFFKIANAAKSST